jgi:hypothetical protein
MTMLVVEQDVGQALRLAARVHCLRGGVVAVAAALFARRGLWGIVTLRRDVRLFPTGYHVRHEEVPGG